MSDQHYWEQVYTNRSVPQECSLFAQFVRQNYLQLPHHVIELGCGNGRDAHYLVDYCAQLTAVDQCKAEITRLQRTNHHPNLKFMVADFTHLPIVHQQYDLIYSRFTLHSISSAAQQRVLSWTKKAVTASGWLCIEARGYRNSLYQRGQSVPNEPDAFIYNDHYRRFINLPDLVAQLKNQGWQIVLAREDQGFAPFAGQDDYFWRLVATLP